MSKSKNETDNVNIDCFHDMLNECDPSRKVIKRFDSELSEYEKQTVANMVRDELYNTPPLPPLQDYPTELETKNQNNQNFVKLVEQCMNNLLQPGAALTSVTAELGVAPQSKQQGK